METNTVPFNTVSLSAVPLASNARVCSEEEQTERLARLRSEIGGKAASLQQLADWQMPVPDFHCISVSDFKQVLQYNDLQVLIDWMEAPQPELPLELAKISDALLQCRIPEAIIQRVQHFIAHHPDLRFAVRSSGTLEDGSNASFAGLYQTVLNVTGIEPILEAMRQCWIAFFDPRVLAYINQRNIRQPMGLALVIQCLVPSEKSGVIFTIDPVKGEDKAILIEACFGLGEALVSGQVNPDQYRYHWFDDCETERHIAEKTCACIPIAQAPYTQMQTLDPAKAKAEVLSTDEVAQLAKIALELQCRSGFPVDIEWGMYQGQIYILQNRPITELGFAGIEGEWTTADFRDGGVSSSVCTPYMASLYQYVMQSSMTKYLKDLGLNGGNKQDTWLQSFYSRPYWNLSAAKSYLSQIIDYNERAFDEGLGIPPQYEGQGVVSKLTPKSLFLGLRALWVIKRNCKQKLRDCPQFAAQQKQNLNALAAMNFDTMPAETLYAFCTQFLNEDYYRSESTYFDFIYDNSNLNSLFKDSVSKLDFDDSSFAGLLTGLSGVSHLAQIEGLWQIRDQIDAAPELRDYWTQNSPAQICQHYTQGQRDKALDAFENYLQLYGHHARKELDLSVPRYREEPDYVIGQLQEVLTQPKGHDPRLRSTDQGKQAEQARAQLLACVPKWRRKGLAAKLKQVREFLWWREELRDLSTQYYYYVRKISLAVAKRLHDEGRLQAQEDVFFLQKNQLLDLINDRLNPPSAQALIDKNRDYYNSFRHYTIPDEVGYRHSGSTAENSASGDQVGVSGSPGIATGIARVIADINDADRLQPGDILVTRCTDPGWTPKFAMLAGVVTETGGMLSHAAVICREYGIPAVLAVKGATRDIPDGASITIDGSQGRFSLNTDN